MDLNFGSILSNIYERIVLCEFESTRNSEEYKKLARHFSEEVQLSIGWKDFLNLRVGSSPPVFIPIIVESKENYIEMTMHAYLYPSLFEPHAGIMDVVVEKINDEWVFTKIENVKAYSSLYDFREDNSNLYETTVKMISYLYYLGKLK